MKITILFRCVLGFSQQMYNSINSPRLTSRTALPPAAAVTRRHSERRAAAPLFAPRAGRELRNGATKEAEKLPASEGWTWRVTIWLFNIAMENHHF